MRWPEGARSLLVVAVAHPPERPELDWWFGRIDPPGNRVLARIVQGLCDWAVGDLGLRTTHLPYHVERGGIYLKDAAVLAGLGCVGLNNLLVTPDFGPRVRLRALALDVALPPPGSRVSTPVPVAALRAGEPAHSRSSRCRPKGRPPASPDPPRRVCLPAPGSSPARPATFRWTTTSIRRLGETRLRWVRRRSPPVPLR